MKRVFLAGEGRHELGGWAKEPPYRDPSERGVLEALLRRCCPEGWQVAEARLWKKVPKFQAKKGIHGAETRIVLGLIELARHAGCDVLVFVRDADRMIERADEIAAAIREDAPVIGGAAVRTLDAWCLALRGQLRSEDLRLPKDVLESAGCGSTSDRVATVEAADLDALPADAYSLRSWLDRAHVVMSR